MRNALLPQLRYGSVVEDLVGRQRKKKKKRENHIGKVLAVYKFN